MADADQKEVQFLRRTIDVNKASFYSRRRKNRRLAFILRMAAVGIGTSVTIAVGARQYFEYTKWDTILSIVALILSALLPVIAACEAFFDPRWLWVQYTDTLGRLYSISDDLDYLLAVENEPPREKLDELYTRLQLALQETNTAWTNKRLKDEAADKADKDKASP